jgi:hypothetical protein
MAKLISAYQSADGKEFATELEADAHDLSLSMAANIAAYIEVTGLKKAEATRASKYISGFAAFSAGNAGDAVAAATAA